MAQGYRPDRVGDQIRQELSEMLSRGAVHDPGIGFITLTRVKVSADLQVARVYYTSMGDPKALKDTARALAGNYEKPILSPMLSFFREFWSFLRVRKKYWLVPIFIMMVIFGGLIVLTQGSAVAPFIYTLF